MTQTGIFAYAALCAMLRDEHSVSPGAIQYPFCDATCHFNFQLELGRMCGELQNAQKPARPAVDSCVLSRRPARLRISCRTGEAPELTLHTLWLFVARDNAVPEVKDWHKMRNK